MNGCYDVPSFDWLLRYLRTDDWLIFLVLFQRRIITLFKQQEIISCFLSFSFFIYFKYIIQDSLQPWVYWLMKFLKSTLRMKRQENIVFFCTIWFFDSSSSAYSWNFAIYQCVSRRKRPSRWGNEVGRWGILHSLIVFWHSSDWVPSRSIWSRTPSCASVFACTWDHEASRKDHRGRRVCEQWDSCFCWFEWDIHLFDNSLNIDVKPEYGSYMIEATPKLPYDEFALGLNSIEENMRLRYVIPVSRWSLHE